MMPTALRPLLRHTFAWLCLLLSLPLLAQNTPQTITWIAPNPPTAPLNVPITLKAIASSGLPVTYRVLAGPALLEGDELKATDSGTIAVEARAPANAQYRAGTNRIFLNPQAIQLTPLGELPVAGTNASRCIRLQGRYAYIATGLEGIKIIDLQDPAVPQLVGELDTPQNAMDLDMVGNLVYVADGNALLVVDVTDPTKPTQICRLEGIAPAYAVRVHAGRAYVAAQSIGLIIVDIDNPAKPTRLGTYNSPGEALGLHVQDDFVFLADGPQGLQVVDVTDPLIPRRAAGYNSPGRAWGIHVAGGTAYLADGTAGLVTLDIRQPYLPVVLDTLAQLGDLRSLTVRGSTVFGAAVGGLAFVDVTLPGDVRKMTSLPAGPWPNIAALDVAGDLLAIITQQGQLQLYRHQGGIAQTITGPIPTGVYFTNAPITLAYNASSGLPVQLSVVSGPARMVDGQLLLTGAGVVQLQADQPGNAQFFPATSRGSLKVEPNQSLTWLAPEDPLLKPGVPHRLRAEASSGLPVTYRVLAGPAHIIGDDLIITNTSTSGSVVVTADQVGSEAYVPVSLHRSFNHPDFSAIPLALDLQFPADVMCLVGSRAYLADAGGLRILDVQNPAQPVELGRAWPPLGQQPLWLHLAVVEGRAYLADYLSRVWVFDVSDPTQPKVLGGLEAASQPTHVAVQGNVAYVAVNGGLRILDVQNPALPVLLGYVATRHIANSVSVRGTLVYLLSYEDGFQIFDVRQPAQPRLVGSLPIDLGESMEIRDDLMAVVLGFGALHIVDVQDPTQPRLLGRMGQNGAQALTVHGNFAFLVGSFRGVRVADLTDLTQPAYLRYSDTQPEGPRGRFVQIHDGNAWWTTPEGLFRSDVHPRIPPAIDPAFALTYTREGQTLRLIWNYPAALLETAPGPDGPWIQLTADSPFDVPITSDSHFFRVRSQE